MASLVINNNITSRRSLTSGQTLQLGSFIIAAHTAIKPIFYVTVELSMKAPISVSKPADLG